MKKIFCNILLVIFILFATIIISSCSAETSNNNKEINVVTTIYPEYDWVRTIIGPNNKNIDLDLLLKNGVDLHSYKPSAEDVKKIAESDVFIYVGGHSDDWIKSVLKNNPSKNRVEINLMDILKDHLSTTNNHMHIGEHHDHHHDSIPDEHVWLSLDRAQISIFDISQALSEKDPQNSSLYQKNTSSYIADLNQLDKKYLNTVKKCTNKTLIFADRFPFHYLAEDYNLDYYAAFSGCSAESEVSFSTICSIAEKVDELGINNILTIENRNHKIPESVIEQTKSKSQSILVMNSMQSINENALDNNMSYIEIMAQNLDVLKEALE